MEHYGLDYIDSTILVIRNPYNHYASVLKWKRNRILGNPSNFKRAWMAMAKEAKAVPTSIDGNSIAICFDDWVSNPKLREDIAVNELGLQFNDRRINTVMKIGIGRAWGSSFDGMTKNGQAQTMAVTERWRDVCSDENFQKIYNDTEIEECALSFGMHKPI